MLVIKKKAIVHIRHPIPILRDIYLFIYFLFTGCSSMDIKHDVKRFKSLTGCSIIEGHLIISGFNDKVLVNYTFPELKEVTEYVIFYQAKNIVDLKNLFPNLAVIRGNKLVSVSHLTSFLGGNFLK